jgi:hypothetical protein
MIVAALLWCPFLCLEASASSLGRLFSGGEGIAVRACGGCWCCHARTADADEQSSPSLPVEPADDCECPDCVCKRAVTSGSATSVVPAGVAPLNVIATSSLSVAGNAVFGDHVPDTPAASVPSGHDVVIRYGNLRV